MCAEVLETFRVIRQGDQEVAIGREERSTVKWLKSPDEISQRLMRNIARCLHRSGTSAIEGRKKVRCVFIATASYPVPPVSRFESIDLTVDMRYHSVTWLERVAAGDDVWTPAKGEHLERIRIFFDLPFVVACSMAVLGTGVVCMATVASMRRRRPQLVPCVCG